MNTHFKIALLPLAALLIFSGMFAVHASIRTTATPAPIVSDVHGRLLLPTASVARPRAQVQPLYL